MAHTLLLRRALPRPTPLLRQTAAFPRYHSTLTPSIPPLTPQAGSTVRERAQDAPLPPLSRLPTPQLLRSLLLTSVMLSPPLLQLTIPPLLNNTHLLERPSPLKWAVDKTFYPQYCTGDRPEIISRTLEQLKTLGEGVILSYARESDGSSSADTQLDIWRKGTVDTINLTPPGDFAAIKLSGAGGAIDLASNAGLRESLEEICETAERRNVFVLVDAEHLHQQDGIDNVTLDLMRKWNRTKPVIYNTYQMYLQRSPAVLQRHLEMAEREGWLLGAKVVRGAYIASDPRRAIWATKAETDKAYDDAIQLLLQNPSTSRLMVASHNRDSIMKAREMVRDLQAQGKEVTEPAYAQLLGMADELSLELVGLGERVVKYAVWGTTRECVDYLLRRVEENRDVAGRGRGEFQALMNELRRRLGFRAVEAKA